MYSSDEGLAVTATPLPAAGRAAGKVASVTGAAGGIGQAIALRLGQQGASIVLNELDPVAGQAAAQALREQGIPALFVQHDVRDEAAWAAAVAPAVAHFGALDILVNNAGIALPPPDGFEALTLDGWRRVMTVNLDVVFLGTREGVRAMKASGGAIINIGSVSAYIGTPGGAAYGSSKGGVRSLSRQAAVACARTGCKTRINTIHPSWIWTPLVEKAATARWGEADARPTMAAQHPSAKGRPRRCGLCGAVPGQRRGAAGERRRSGGGRGFVERLSTASARGLR